MSRGLSETEASATIVSGFVEPITKELPVEYAVAHTGASVRMHLRVAS